MGGTEVALRPEVSGTYTSGRQPLQQRRLARSVGAGEEDEFSRSHLKGDVPDQRVVVVADCQMVDLKDRRMYIVDCQCFMGYCLGKMV